MSSRKRAILAAICLVVLLFAGLLYMRLSADDTKQLNQTTNNVDQSNQTDENQDEETKPSEETGPAQAQDQPTNPSPAPQPAPAAPKISITGKQQAGQVVQVRAVVNNLTAGTCQATFTGPQGTQPFARTSPIVNKGNFYGCTDIDIPVAAFPKAGVWHMEIFAANQNNKSNIAEADITVTK